MNAENLLPIGALTLFIVLLSIFIIAQVMYLRWHFKARREGLRTDGRVIGSRLARSDSGASQLYFQVSFTTRDGNEVRVEDEIPGFHTVDDRPPVTVLYHPDYPECATLIGPSGVPSSRPRIITVCLAMPFLIGALVLLAFVLLW